jgi:hypothetical protein
MRSSVQRLQLALIDAPTGRHLQRKVIAATGRSPESPTCRGMIRESLATEVRE